MSGRPCTQPDVEQVHEQRSDFSRQHALEGGIVFCNPQRAFLEGTGDRESSKEDVFRSGHAEQGREWVYLSFPTLYFGLLVLSWPPYSGPLLPGFLPQGLRHGLGVGKQAGKLVTPASALWEGAVALASGAPALSIRELVS